MNLNKYIKNNLELKGAILGTLMGDTCIIKRKENWNGYFSLTHSQEQLEYLKFKASIFEMNSLTKTKISKRITYLKKTNKEYVQYQCISNNNTYATKIYNMVYKNNRKIINENILNSITDFGLFLWYLDDGYLNIRYDKVTGKIKEYRVFLYTMNFTLDEVILIQKWFEKKYNIVPNINKKQNGYILYFNSKKTRAFMEIINKYYGLVPCLNRKFLKEYI